MCLYACVVRGERSFVFVCYLCVEGGCVVLCACALCNVLTVSSSICAAGAVLHLNAALIVSWMPEPEKGLRWRGLSRHLWPTELYLCISVSPPQWVE